MKTIEEIMKITACDSKLAEKMYNDLIGLPEELGNFMADHLDIVNAYNADDIEVVRHYGYSKTGCNIIVKRINKRFPVFSDGTHYYNHWNYCFDCVIGYTGVSVY